ncbi:MAG: hypothetical protein L0211_01935 [Planctomycetaceae bacterium]|nr:hypothetical protein [Planctomycetaceae bacterium]
MHTQHNRLTIAHLLLWTATTGVALAYLVAHKPPPAESIGFASFLTQPGQDVEVEMAKARQKFHRQLQKNYRIGLAAAPVYGAALAGTVLAIWRVLTLRFGFPKQPGHWLLIVIASLMLAHVAHPWLRSLLNWADGPDFAWSIFMALAATAVAIGVREPMWRCAIGLLAFGFGIMCVAYVISFYSNPFEPPGLFVVGILFVAAFPLGSLICTAVDLAERKPYDALHWIGIVSLAGVVMHFLAIWGAARYSTQ